LPPPHSFPEEEYKNGGVARDTFVMHPGSGCEDSQALPARSFEEKCKRWEVFNSAAKQLKILQIINTIVIIN
jgi:hypothetical protein